MTTTDRQTGARLLRQLRDQRGWSWVDLARAVRGTAQRLGVTSVMTLNLETLRRAVARWENTTNPTGPQTRYRLLLAHLYATTPAGAVALGPGSDFDTYLEALRHFGTAPTHIRELVDLIVQSTTGSRSDPLAMLSPELQSSVTALQRDPRSCDRDVLRAFHGSITAINGEVGAIPFVRLQLRLAPIVQSCRQLLHAELPGLREKLIVLAADTYALAARMAFETRDDETALALYDEASSVAEEFVDRSHRAAIATSYTMVTLHSTNDLDTSRTIARSATLDAHHGHSYAIRARAHAVHAEICARAGEADEASRALDRAWKTVEQLSIDDPFAGFDADRLSGFDGLCALHAGDPGHAQDSLSRSVATLKASTNVVQLGIVSADLALARLRLGDPVACTELLHETVDIAAATGGRVAAQRLRIARRHLREWRTEDFVAELDEHIHETFLGR